LASLISGNAVALQCPHYGAYAIARHLQPRSQTGQLALSDYVVFDVKTAANDL